MKKRMGNRNLLTQAVLASSLFVAPLAYATTFGPGQVIGPISTGTYLDNTVEVLPTGQIFSPATDAVRLNSPGGIVITDVNNTFAGFNAIQTTAAASSGVFITGNNGTLTVGAGSGVNATGAGSYAVHVLGATGTQIVNSGTLESNLFETVGVGGNNTTLTNTAGGVIRDRTALGFDTIVVGSDGAGSGTGFTLFNAGNILQGAIGNQANAIRINDPNYAITNLAGGVIQNTFAAGAGNANAIGIALTAAGVGSIINNAGALISAANGFGITVDGALVGSIVNAGTIESAGPLNSAIGIFANLTSLINSGNIFNNSAAQATISSGAVVFGSLINSGNITNLNAAGSAITLLGSTTYTQNAGIVKGNVNLAPFDGAGGNKVFFMNGGTIIGNVNTAANPNQIALSGGTIAGNMNGSAGAETFALSGTNILGTLAGGDANDIFNITGGSYGTLDGGAGIDEVNINKTFTSTGQITNVESINVNNAGTVFTVNSPITNMNAGGTGLTVNAGTTLVQNADISGAASINNFGNYDVNGAVQYNTTAGGFLNRNGGNLNISSTGQFLVTSIVFTNQPGATLNVDLAGPTQFGRLVTTVAGANVNFNAGSFIAPHVKAFIPNGSAYDIVRNTAGTIVDNSTLVQSSALVNFIKIPASQPDAPNTIIRLIASRNAFASFASSTTNGVAGTLDELALGNGPTGPLLGVLGQFDQLATGQEVQDAMESLTPPVNYGLVQGSYLGMNMVFDNIIDRMDDLHIWNQHEYEKRHRGINSGDWYNPSGLWVKILGAHLEQDEIDDVDGYTAKSGGIAFGADFEMNDCTTVGAVLSYNRVTVDDKNINPKNEGINSWQATGYAWLDFTNGIYLDGMMALALNDYDINRVININEISTAANASFDGVQFGLQSDLGWYFRNTHEQYISPFVRLKYTYLNLDDYTENGADGLDLSVSNENINQFLGGVGVKFSSVLEAQRIVWVPKATFMIGYDFVNDGEQTVANFSGGGTAFATNGVTPSKTVFDFDASLNAHVTQQSIFTIKYNLELREQFVGNAGYFEYYYLWN